MGSNAAARSTTGRDRRVTERELVVLWREEAQTLERYGDERGATMLRRNADDLEAAMRAAADEALDLDAAAAESGYSKDRLRHMISDGTLPNAGRKGSPRVRRVDLPRKSSRASTFDAELTARKLVSR